MVSGIILQRLLLETHKLGNVMCVVAEFYHILEHILEDPFPANVDKHYTYEFILQNYIHISLQPCVYTPQ